MPFIYYLLLTFNFLWLFYLTVIFYKKFSLKSKAGPSDPLLSATNSNKNIQKLSLTRFNPFDEMGGDQSFILCLLDNTNSGVIITSLHNRDTTRLYAKEIKNGQSESAALSKEEKSTLLKTIKS